jgi:hypothetical protein
MIPFNGTNAVLTALGDDAVVRDVTLLNQTSNTIIEPLTGIPLPPNEAVLIRLTGDVAFESISNNVEQINLLRGFEAIALTDDLFVPVAPSLAGGSLALDGVDLVLTAPTIAGGDPIPTIVLTSLTRDRADVMSDVVGGVIANAPAGEYVALWTASNGVDPDATATDTLVVV